MESAGRFPGLPLYLSKICDRANAKITEANAGSRQASPSELEEGMARSEEMKYLSTRGGEERLSFEEVRVFHSKKRVTIRTRRKAYPGYSD